MYYYLKKISFCEKLKLCEKIISKTLIFYEIISVLQ